MHGASGVVGGHPVLQGGMLTIHKSTLFIKFRGGVLPIRRSMLFNSTCGTRGNGV